ncbi:hypothetical protein MMC26_000031 [Xylographa opegraphella]|nr:hypothetical protein [Xylographa opegraphella]
MDPLPPDAIQRVLFVSPSVHVYAIPPLTSTKGYLAASWTTPSVHQFPACRLRIVETAIPSSSTPATSTSLAPTASETLTTTLLLEDPSTGDLFAASPYTTPAAVSPALDSSRFFAVRVVGEGGRKAVLGIGFEERAEAFDFGVALQEVRKVLGMDGGGADGKGLVGEAPAGKRKVGGKENVAAEGPGKKRDWSLKEGESIHVDVGGRGRERRKEGMGVGWIAPPSAGAGVGFLPPPPSAREVREEKRREAKEMGFDDGEFGEFQ